MLNVKWLITDLFVHVLKVSPVIHLLVVPKRQVLQKLVELEIRFCMI